MSRVLVENFLIPAVKIGILLNVILGVVAYVTLLERKVIAFMQARLGPRRVGFHGILQPIADVLKLFIKEDISPAKADRLVFFLAPIITLVPALISLAVIPFAGEAIEVFGYQVTPWIADVNIGLLYLLAISSLGVYGIILG
ncbi:MAG: complex I subunit 1 family protein, partial [Acidobacteriota bacterium]